MALLPQLGGVMLMLPEAPIMGTVTHHGWSKPGDDIPQPTGIVSGRNLRKPPAAPHVSRPFGHHPDDIAEWCRKEDERQKPRGPIVPPGWRER